MQQYDAYKDSGVEWIGEIPEGWDLRRISSLYDARNEKVSDQDYPALSVTMQGIVPQLETAAKTQDGDNRKLVKVGDFVINSRSDRRGACGISDFDGSVTLISNVLAPKSHLNMRPRYYSYLFRSEGFADEYYRQGTGIVDDLWSTNWSRMKNILVACPPLGEQEAIADYLDVKTAEIDALVADCEHEVELLREYRKAVISEAVTKGLDPTVPMKDSGIEWIGEIPEGWTVHSFKFIGYVAANLQHPQDYPNLMQVSPDRIEKDTGHLFPCATVKDAGVESDNHLFSTGDILYSKVRPALNKATVAPFDGMCSADMYPIKTSQNARWLLYYMLSNAFLEQVAVSTDRVKMPKINKEELGKFKVMLPEPNVQLIIADYLDAKTAEIDALIADKCALVDKLCEYHKSLISEAVRGKFKVPGV